MTQARNSNGSYLFSRLELALALMVGLVLGATHSAASEAQFRLKNAGAKSRLAARLKASAGLGGARTSALLKSSCLADPIEAGSCIA